MSKIILSFVLVLTFFPVSAQDRPNPADVRFILPLPGESTSTCIGDRRTPLCGVETAIACANFVRIKECPRSHDGGEDVELYRRVEYVFREYGHVNRKLIEQRKRDNREDGDFEDYPWLRANVFQARVWERYCFVGEENCNTEKWEDKMYSVYPRKGLWPSANYHSYSADYWFVDQPIFFYKQ
jgi:hypothetical protein